MDQSIKQIFLQDILESIETTNRDLKISQDGLKWIEEKIALYSGLEKRLGNSVDDENLRKYIQRRLERWEKIGLEDKQKIQEAEDKIKFLEGVQENIENRKDDLSL